MDRFLSGEWGRGLLLEYVFLEIVTVLMMRREREAAARVSRILLTAEELEFIPCSELFSETLRLFLAQTSTKLSFVDAAISYVAQQRAEGLVLSFDKEFRKIAGIRMPQPRSRGAKS